MDIRPFGVEEWMNTWETEAVYNIAETCVNSLTLGELLDMSGRREEILAQLADTRLTYGDITGSERLRGLIAGLYRERDPETVLVMNGGSAANFLALFTLVKPGDRVISVWPTYQQMTSIPEAFGARVDVLPLRPENNWLPDLDELRDMAKNGADLICVNNPNNPTGSLMEESFLRDLADIARSAGAWLLCDEAYRGLVHEEGVTVPAAADMYEKAISTSSMSKVFSLAGIRSGWLTGPKDFVDDCFLHRDYTTISCGPVSDVLACVALENREQIMKRNLGVIRESLGILEQWVESEPGINWVKPRAGTTAFIGYDYDIPSDEFCIGLFRKNGAFLLPGKCFDIERRLRVGYAYGAETLRKGLAGVSEWLRELESRGL